MSVDMILDIKLRIFPITWTSLSWIAEQNLIKEKELKVTKFFKKFRWFEDGNIVFCEANPRISYRVLED